MKAVLLALLCAVCGAVALPLADRNQISVSGISAGGFFASQVHVALSSQVMGVGVVTGGPYFCALDTLQAALIACMTEPVLIDMNLIYDAVDAFVAAGVIDNPTNLTRSKVYLLHGTNDFVVNQGVVAAVGTFYSKWIASANIASKFDLPAAHSFITNKFGNPCSQFGSPYINNCNFDGAFAILSQIYGALNTPIKANPKNLVTFDQSKFIPSGASLSDVSLDATGYMYIPSKCNGTRNACRLHFAFHGCNQMVSAIGQDFVMHTGYNEIAEANNIIVVYPQTVASYYPVNNPEGCYDWWGYTGVGYATRDGPQIAFVQNLITALTQ